jgi:pyruvate dehydrogenase E1 component beta subunit
MPPIDLLISAGEASGDMYAARLAKALRERADVRMFGMGGPQMRAAGVEIVVDYADVTLVGWGAMVGEALSAAETLAASGISAEVIDVATLKPLDSDTIVASVRKTGRCVIVHEAPLTGGFGGEIAARVAEQALLSLLAPVERVAGYDTVIPLPRLEQHYFPNARRIVEAARRAMAYG